ncbi:CoA-transferase [Ventosimonas gracilis]|uniref:CoA-transferase n=1 Tax=Ventosimonas gracilis TaxID=1680762 RepID=A0A139SVY5_9GAMM|nr:CaiB/BaiF CoA-transferase family protein [Ventosimonas gracilis]KXU38601.1 CoA-transferase [Ventosimonas gracilis]
MSALSGIRVLDLSRILAGPWAGQILADLGAEVIKVERPGSGDDTRGWGPPFVKDPDGVDGQEAAYYHCANRNKQSITLDFTQKEGQQLAIALAKQSDVLIENFKVGGLAAYGLDYPSLKAINPKLIYCSITGFGQNGPYAKRAGYDFMIQGMGGLMSLTGHPDTEEGGGPMKVGVALTDIQCGLYSAIGILAALVQREKTGEGQHIDMALLDVQVACLANQAMNYLVSGQSPKRLGNAHPNIVPYQDFPTADGNMILAIGNDRQFRAFCELADCIHLADNPDFATNAARVKNRSELIPLLRQRTVFKTTANWITLLEAASVPCGPINNLQQVFANEQVKARGLHLDLPHPTFGSVPQVASPLRLSKSPVSYHSAAPQLGEHTEHLLTELLGLSSAEIAQLRTIGVI